MSSSGRAHSTGAHSTGARSTGARSTGARSTGARDDALPIVAANAHLHLELSGGEALVCGVSGSFQAHLYVGDVRPTWPIAPAPSASLNPSGKPRSENI